MYNYPLMKKKSTGFYNYDIPYAAKFPYYTSATAAFLGRTWSVDPDNSLMYTISAWIKPGALRSNNTAIMSGGLSSTNRGAVIWYDNYKIGFYRSSGGTSVILSESDGFYRDFSNWYHVFIQFDTSQAVGQDRRHVYINGVETTDTATAFLQNYGLRLTNNGDDHRIGYNYTTSNAGFYGYMAELHLIDGIIYNPTDFGEFKYNTWIPKKVTGINYGTNGYYLNFADALDVGKDVSGNDNHMSQLGTNDVIQTTDTPTNNYPILDSIDPLSTGTISDAGLTVAGGVAKSTIKPSTGKWYYEVDGVGVTYDADVSGEFNPDLAAGTYNFGADPFSDTQPAGYKTICTKNLPIPDIIDSTTGYETLLYTGDGVDGRQFTNLNFNPSLGSLIWTKDMDSAAADGMFDTIRGGNNPLSMLSTSTEAGIDDFGLMTFLSNGFQMNEGTNATNPMGLFNNSGDEYIAYCFRKLPAYGIDIVTWDGNNSNREIPHSLGVAPELIYVKERDGTHVWIVGYEYCTASTPWHYYGVSTAAAFAAASNVWNDTPPTSSVFTVGTNANMNTTGKSYVAFLFTSISGFSSFKGHIGNGNVNGPRIYTDFTPAMWMVRNCSFTTSLIAFDSARNPYNYAERYWAPGLTNTETTNVAYQFDWLSNGIKIRGTGVYFNRSGNYHLNMMFAKIPFPFTNAV